jgi:TolB-like protein/DNA-binding winged helix-turn-helix (wHTH) protein
LHSGDFSIRITAFDILEAGVHVGAIAKFGTFELDLRTLELRNRGIRLHVRRQSGEILAMLIDRRGEVVTREEIRKKLWADGTVVEFEHSVNSAVNRLRDLMGESAGHPRYIETLPRLGYRFVGAVEISEPGSIGASAVSNAQGPPESSKRLIRRSGWRIAAVTVIAGGLVLAFSWKLIRPRAGASPPIRSIAVLPLVNLSHDAEQEYFTDGMTEALTSDLAQIGSVRVISRTSAMTYKASRKPLRAIAGELQVDALVEGSVLHSGQRVRVVAHLINSSTDMHVWSGTYERDLRDVLKLQSELAQAIAREIRAALSLQEAAHLATRRAVKPEAYEAYLKGMFYLNKFTPDGFERGIAYLHQATENDPSDPFAYAALALGYAMAGHERFPDAFSRSKAAALKSLDLGGPLAEAYAALGMQEMYWEWDIARGGRDLERALALNPNFAEARRNYSWYLRLLGKRKEGLEEMRRAEMLDPLEPQISADFAWQYLAEGDYDASLTEAQKALDVNPSFCQALAITGWVYAAKGRPAEAIALQKRAGATDSAWKWPLGRTYALMGLDAEAKAVAADIEKNPGPMDQWGLVVIYSALGERDRAFRWLEVAYQSRFSWVPWISAYAVPSQDAFARLRDDRRFDDLVRRIGFAQPSSR